MKFRFRRNWRTYKAGQETDAIPDGIANTLIRSGAAALVEETENDLPIEDNDEGQQADDGDATDDGTSDAGGGEAPTVSSGVRHKQRSSVSKPNSGGT